MAVLKRSRRNPLPGEIIMNGNFKKITVIMSLIIFSPSIFCVLTGGLKHSCNESLIYLYAADKKDLMIKEDNAEAAGDENNLEKDSIGEGAGSFNFSADGFAELENYYSSDKNKTKKERNLKNELRVNLEFKAGSENLFLYSKTNLYYTPQLGDKEPGEKYHYRNGFDVSDNLTISDKNYEIEPNELYLNYSNSLFRLRAGNQVYLWGTADVYNPTSYFNPLDLREYVFADEDELKLAVPSGSLMFFLGFATVEMVFVPVHIPAEIPADGNYWQIKSESALMTLNVQENKGLDKDISNAAYGIRSSFSPGGVDFSLSYYHGPDRNPVFVPQYIDIYNSPASLEVQPEYFIVNMFGFDLSTQISDFVIQCEAVYSPDKTWLVERDFSEFMMTNLYSGRSGFETEKSHYVHYAAGFNYYIPVNKFIKDYDGESIITVEWQQPWYADKDLMAPFLTKIFLLRFEEICFDSRLKLSASYLAEMNKNAYVIKPEIKYDFQNGLSLKASYVYINAESDSESVLPGEDTSVIYFLRDKDMASLSVRYDF